MKTMLILTLMGQYCVSRGVQQSYCAPTYVAPAYNQVYAVPYVEKVKFVAVEQPGYDYYAALAAASSRSYERFQEYAQVPQQAAVTYSIPSPVQVAQQPVYQAPAPVKTAPQPVQATAQYSIAQATPQAYGTPQQPAYGAPGKASPPQLQTPAKNPSGDGGNVPPSIIQQGPVNYSSAMGTEGEVPPPPVPKAPQAYQQPPVYLQPNPVISSVNSHFLSVLTKNCASCHTGISSKGGFQLFDYPGRLASISQGDLQNIADQVASRKMPFKRVMSDSDRQAVLGMLSGNVSSLVSR
jgi:hypothetical protein